jgi:hypothetical protein
LQEKLLVSVLNGRDNIIKAAEQRAIRGEMRSAHRPGRLSVQELNTLGEYPDLETRYSNQRKRELELNTLNSGVIMRILREV